jgi:hypothetical protein
MIDESKEESNKLEAKLKREWMNKEKRFQVAREELVQCDKRKTF